MMRWHVKLAAFRLGVPVPPIPISRPLGAELLRLVEAAPRNADGKIGTLDVALPQELQKELNDVFHSVVPLTELHDVAQIFFQQCFHLKDWIRNDGSSAAAAASVEAYVSSSPELEAARDICNGSKHLNLRAPRVAPTVKARDLLATVKAGKHYLTATPTVEVQGKRHDLFELADRCVAEWQRYLSQHGI